MATVMTLLDDWEARWAPYDEPTYLAALNFVKPNDIVLDIGAGDLRLSIQMATIARQVYAIERQPELLNRSGALPSNLAVICADARQIPWPAGLTVGVLLMRHCTHVAEYVRKLRALGCQRLITNARWGMDVEQMDLGPRIPWEQMKTGWYACTCGQTGYIEGPAEQLTEAHIWHVTEVENCPACIT